MNLFDIVIFLRELRDFSARSVVKPIASQSAFSEGVYVLNEFANTQQAVFKKFVLQRE